MIMMEMTERNALPRSSRNVTINVTMMMIDQKNGATDWPMRIIVRANINRSGYIL